MIQKGNETLYFIVYRYRFLALYILFGIISLIVEFVIKRTLQSFGFSFLLSEYAAFAVGLLTAFSLNVRFNFHIASAKRKKALFYFSIISFFSFCIQLLFRRQFMAFSMSEELSRVFTAGLFFLFSYVLHRRFSFKEFKKVGVAIYADGVEDIRKIYGKIGTVSDFIHIDIVDTTFKPDCADVKAYRAEVVRAYWQHKPIEVHVMSRQPSRWLPELVDYVNVIYIHTSLDEDIYNVFSEIRKGKAVPGIVIGIDDDFSLFEPYLREVNHVLILAIMRPGFSGQQFEMRALELVDKLAAHPLRSKITVCIDGGVNEQTIKYLNVESVVSGSFVLNAPNPQKNIMLLQTSGEYERF
jgi:ribulose-phosphate 3-epimerase